MKIFFYSLEAISSKCSKLRQYPSSVDHICVDIQDPRYKWTKIVILLKTKYRGRNLQIKNQNTTTKELDDLKVRRNRCEDDLRLLQQELSFLQDKLLDFQLAGDETKTRILEKAIAEKKGDIAKKEDPFEEFKNIQLQL